MARHRILTLARKDLLELSRTPGVLVPIAITMAVTIAIPLVIGLVIPWLTGDSLGDDDDLRGLVEMAARYQPGLGQLPIGAAVQAFLFQQFLFLFILIPVTAAMSLASYSVIGEKQARTLEPLLSTPITTLELLLAKLLSSAAPAVASELFALAVYLGCIALFAGPGVLEAVLSARSIVVMLVIGPLTALVSLLMAVIASSRANDPRSAQQIGVLVILPVIGLVVGQFAGLVWLTVAAALLLAVALLGALLLLLWFGVRVFEREAILTRWK